MTASGGVGHIRAALASLGLTVTERSLVSERLQGLGWPARAAWKASRDGDRVFIGRDGMEPVSIVLVEPRTARPSS